MNFNGKIPSTLFITINTAYSRIELIICIMITRFEQIFTTETYNYKTKYP